MSNYTCVCLPVGINKVFHLIQSQVVSDPLRQNGALDGLVLGGLRVFGVPSPPRYVWANGKKVWDFSYLTDTKVSGSWLSYLYRV